MKKLYILLIITFCATPSLFAQTNFNEIFYSIDSLESIGQPQAALEKIEKLQISAKKEANESLFLKCTVYKIKFMSYLQEDAIVNIITGLDQEIKIANFPSRNILQSLKAEILSKYYNQNSYKITKRIDLNTQNPNFTFWGTTKILAEINYLYEASLSKVKDLQNIPLNDYNNILIGNQEARKYRPTLYDLLAHRALDYYFSRNFSINQPKPLFLLLNSDLFKPAATFSQINLYDEQADHSYLKGLKLIQQATAFHLANNNEDALADLELRKLDFIYNNTTIYNKDSLYLQRLVELSKQTKLNTIASEATAKLAQFYYKKNELTKALIYYQKLEDLATNKYDELLAKDGLKAITETEINLNFESTNIPDQAILGLITYKNTQQAVFKIYKINDDESNKLKKYSFYQYNTRDADSLYNYLKIKPIYRLDTLKLPTFDDYQNHTYEFKIDALPAGTYYLLTDNENASKKFSITTLKISNISIISAHSNKHNKNTILLQERASGKPIEKAEFKVEGYNGDSKKMEKIETPFINTDAGIYVMNATLAVKYNYIDLKVIVKNDTLTTDRITLNQRDYSDDALYKNSFLIYTDRTIYRPGQTVYFKGIWFDITDKKVKLASGFNSNFIVKSTDGTELANIKFITNEYGSFEGSFTIPQQILNGRINFEIDKKHVGNVLLEEYKRPNFEISLAQENQTSRLNDSVTFKGKIKAYNGYALPNAKVAYVLNRSLNYIPNFNQSNFSQQILKADTVLSDKNGEFIVRFLAAGLEGIPIEKQTINYNLKVSVTDENGETQSKSAYTRVKKNNIYIQAQIPAYMIKSKVPLLKVSLKNLAHYAVKGNIEASLIKIEDSKSYLKNRLFQKADSTLISLSDYQKHFPDVEPIEGLKKQLKLETVETLKINKEWSDYTLNFDKLEQLETGNYQIKINAKSLDGDTVSSIFSFYYINKPALAQEIKNWLTVEKSFIEQNEKAKMRINLPNAYLLMEVFDKKKKIQSQWIKTENQPKTISIDLADNPQISVSLLMVYKNRVYTQNTQYYLKQNSEKLTYQFLNFKDKMTPGEKEQISLRITKQNGKPFEAELLATLYDASLDAIYSPQNWELPFITKSKGGNYYFNNWNTYSFNHPMQNIKINNFRFSASVNPKLYENFDFGNNNYYGSYNYAFHNYKNRFNATKINTYQDSLIKVQYLQNAKQVKVGFDYSGRVIDKKTGLGISGAIIRLNGTNINTVSNSFGYFRIKVPENSVLSIAYTGRKVTEITAQKNTNYITIAFNKLLEALSKTASGEPGNDITVNIRGVNSISTSGAVNMNTQVLEGRLAGVNEIVVTGYGGTKNDLRGSVANTNENDVNQIFTNVDDLTGKSLRTNFAETAFFIPQLKPNENGVFNLPFTLPDALTKWNFKALAYDKDLNSIAIDTQITAQKSLMLQSNMPRFFRAGDTVNVKLRIINLTNETLKANLKVEFYNPLNNQPLNIQQNNIQNLYSVSANNNINAEITLAIPHQIEAIGYRFIADAGKFADGEQNSIPVLSNSILLTQSMSMLVKEGESKSFVFDNLLNNKSKTLQNKSLTFEWTANPNWLVAEAIPYLTALEYEGSESVFSALFANSMASVMMDKNPAIKKYFASFKDSSNNNSLTGLAQNPELKSILLKESPWLKNAVDEKEQKRKLALFFEMDAIAKQQSIYINKLKQLQLANGAFPWMNGTYEDQFISQYILAGLGQLKSFNTLTINNTQNEITKKLLTYVKAKINEQKYSYLNTHAWYAISYFENTIPSNLESKWQSYLSHVKENWLTFNLYQQTLAAFTLSRFGEKTLSKTIRTSITDRAIKTKDLGAYWSNINWGCFWYQLPVETHTTIIEMLEETEPSNTLLPELKLWLLRQKQTNNWGTSMSTTQACYALLKKADVLDNNGLPEIKLGDKSIFDIKPNLKTNEQTGYLKTNWVKEEIKPELGKIEISNAPQTAFGAIYWQYTESQDKIKPAANGLTLSRKYYLKNSQDNTYSEIGNNHQAKIGDLIKVIITLNSDRNYEYILLKDMRPSATEPIQQLSRYNYQDNLFYYQVNKDVSTNFFINRLNKGNYVFEYELRVAQSGKFSTGISTIESMYAPEYRSNSSGKLLLFGK